MDIAVRDKYAKPEVLLIHAVVRNIIIGNTPGNLQKKRSCMGKGNVRF